MIGVLKNELLEQLHTFLAKFLPHSLIVRGHVQFQLENRFPTNCNPKTFVNSWPEPTIVWTSYMTPAHAPDWSFCVLFSKEPSAEKLRKFVSDVTKELKNFDKKTHIFVENVDRNSQIVREIYGSHGSIERKNHLPMCFKLLWVPKTKWGYTSGETIAIPDDLYLGTLRNSDTEFVDATWDGRFPGSTEIFREKIAYFPSVALRRKTDDRLVCFCLTDHLGYSNHGYVIEERRGEGLIAKITMLLYQEHVKHGILPYGFMYPTNTRSIQGMKKGGLAEILDIDIEVLAFYPFSELRSKI